MIALLNVVTIMFALFNAVMCIKVDRSWLGALGWFTVVLLSVSILVKTP
jgi:hypothetical protein